MSRAGAEGKSIYWRFFSLSVSLPCEGRTTNVLRKAQKELSWKTQSLKRAFAENSKQNNSSFDKTASFPSSTMWAASLSPRSVSGRMSESGKREKAWRVERKMILWKIPLKKIVSLSCCVGGFIVRRRLRSELIIFESESVLWPLDSSIPYIMARAAAITQAESGIFRCFSKWVFPPQFDIIADFNLDKITWNEILIEFLLEFHS